MKKLDNGDKMIIASVILAIGIAISAYFIANPKSQLEQCVETYLKYETNNEVLALNRCEVLAKGKK